MLTRNCSTPIQYIILDFDRNEPTIKQHEYKRHILKQNEVYPMGLHRNVKIKRILRGSRKVSYPPHTVCFFANPWAPLWNYGCSPYFKKVHPHPGIANFLCGGGSDTSRMNIFTIKEIKTKTRQLSTPRQ